MSEHAPNPYAAPQIDMAPPRSSRGGALLWTSWILLPLLGFHIVVRVLSIGADLSCDMLMIELEAELIDEHSRAELEAAFNRLKLVRELRRASWTVLTLAWLAWAAACNRLARELGFALHYGTLATIGYWFVPIANLIAPRRVLAEIWQASTATELATWRTTSVWKGLDAWWCAFLAMIVVRVTTLVGALELLVVEQYDPIGAVRILRGFLVRDVVQHGLAMVAAALAMVLVSQISSGLRSRGGP